LLIYAKNDFYSLMFSYVILLINWYLLCTLRTGWSQQKAT